MAKYRRKKDVGLWTPFNDVDFEVITAKVFYTDQKTPNNFSWPDGVIKIGQYDDLGKYIDSKYVFITRYGSEWKLSKIKPGDYIATAMATPGVSLLFGCGPRQEVITGEDLERFYDCIECDVPSKVSASCPNCVHWDVCRYNNKIGAINALTLEKVTLLSNTIDHIYDRWGEIIAKNCKLYRRQG